MPRAFEDLGLLLLAAVVHFGPYFDEMNVEIFLSPAAVSCEDTTMTMKASLSVNPWIRVGDQEYLRQV